MNLLVNLIPIKSGGGQQVATNFITQALKNKELSPFFLVTHNTHIHHVLLKNKYEKFYVIKNSLLSRFFFQLYTLNKIVLKNNIEVIYTMFGPGLHHKKIKSVTGCAYSNLFFPEINFWNSSSAMQKVKHYLIDKYRLVSTLKSDFIIFENESMQKRAVKLFNYPLHQTKLILPSISEYTREAKSETFSKRLEKLDKNKYHVLMLSGWHKNKNIEIVPHVLSKLKDEGINDVNFVITVPENHPESIKLLKEAQKNSVEQNISFFDQVLPSEVPFLFEKINAVALFSLLESFSNNIIEAWYFKKPLFISDEEWSRSICKQAGIYVDRESAKDISCKIINFRKSVQLQEDYIKNIEFMIKDYPNPKEKVSQQLSFLKTIK